MNYSIYLTDLCNLNCKYCYEKGTHANTKIDFENVKYVIDREIKSKSKNSIITFFGGEPLVNKKMIYKIVDYIKSKNAEKKFCFNMTTNGSLVDDEFVEFVKSNNFISLSYSIDGTQESHDKNRRTIDDKETFNIVKKNAQKLLKATNVLCAVPVITKNNVTNLYNNVLELLEIGFKRISLQFDFNASWEDNDLDIIKSELRKIADLYIERMLGEKEFEILSFDEKIRSYIDDSFDVNSNCSVGIRGVNVGTDGKIYPCMQFMYNDKYIIGNCKDGIDYDKRDRVHDGLKKEMDICKDCSIRRRCNHTCSCINYSMTKNAGEVSPFTCELESFLIELSDEIAEKLYKEKSTVFLQKFYNSNYYRIENEIWKNDNSRKL